MAINATSKSSTPRELIAPGVYLARCYQLIEIGHVTETINGDSKNLHKVRIVWELPTELKVFKEGDPEKPMSIGEEYTLSTGEKANLRKTIDSWRGQPLSEEDAKSFNVEVLLGQPCMLNITHKTSAKGATFDKISSVVPVIKGMTVPPAFNPAVIISYDNWNQERFDALPDFIKDKMKTSDEYKALTGQAPNKPAKSSWDKAYALAKQNETAPQKSDLPF